MCEQGKKLAIMIEQANESGFYFLSDYIAQMLMQHLFGGVVHRFIYTEFVSPILPCKVCGGEK